MLTTSADYKTAIAATDREMRGYVEFNGDSTKIMRGCDGLISIVTTAQISDEERPMFGCACASICEMTFYNSGLPAGVSLANSYFDAYVGIVLEDTGSAPLGSIEPDTATVEYVWMGRFIIDTIDRSKLSTKVTAYDDFTKLNKPYVCNVAETPAGYPINQIVGDIRTQCNLFASSTPSAPMGYVPKIYECTCRQMYGWVMSYFSLGSNMMARGGNVQNNYYTTVWGAYTHKDDAGHTITDDTIYMGGLADSPTFTFNSVVTGTEDNPVSVGSGTGIVGENPYFDAARATSLYNNINGLTFTPMTIEWRGDPAIQQGDIMKVVTGGNTYYTYVQRIVSTFNGGFKQTFECYGDSEYHYDMSTSPTQAAIKTAVSNMAQEIQQEIETADNGVITKILDLDGSWKELVIANNQDLSAATSVWRWNINGLAHSTAYSGGTYNFAVDMNGRIIANVIQTGILQDALGNNSWNLDTGALTITNGTINITTDPGTTDYIRLNWFNNDQTSMRILELYPGDSSLYGYGRIRMGVRGYNALSPDTYTLTFAEISHNWQGMTYAQEQYVNGTVSSRKTIAQCTANAVSGYWGSITNTGLEFLDPLDPDTVTATYPATGLPVLTGASDTRTMTGGVVAVPYVTAATLGIAGNSSSLNVAKAWAKYVAQQFPNTNDTVFIGTVLANSVRMMQMFAYGTHSSNELDANGIPRYCIVQQTFYDGTITYFHAVTGSYYENISIYPNNGLVFRDNNNEQTFKYPAGGLYLGDITSKNIITESQETISTNYGVTITPNNDGTYTIKGVCTTSFNIVIGTVRLTAGLRYALNGATGGSSSTAYLNIPSVANDTGSGSGEFTVSTTNNYNVRILVMAGSTNLNLTFSPMVRRAGTTDTFAPRIYQLQNLRPRYLDGSVTHYQQTSGTFSIALKQGVYLLSLGRYNTAESATGGLYLITAYPAGTSYVKTISAASGATVSIAAGGILTITTTTNYYECSIIKMD